MSSQNKWGDGIIREIAEENEIGAFQNMKKYSDIKWKNHEGNFNGEKFTKINEANESQIKTTKWILSRLGDKEDIMNINIKTNLNKCICTPNY